MKCLRICLKHLGLFFRLSIKNPPLPHAGSIMYSSRIEKINNKFNLPWGKESNLLLIEHCKLEYDIVFVTIILVLMLQYQRFYSVKQKTFLIKYQSRNLFLNVYRICKFFRAQFHGFFR